jgi:hypothetical protein
MTTTTTYATSPATRNWPAYAVGSSGLAVVLTALAFYVDVFGPAETGPDDPIWAWLSTVGIAIAIGGAVFAGAVRTAKPSNTVRRGLIIGVLSIPTIVVFWSGLPVILASAAACCALANGRPSRLGIVTLVVAAAVFGVGTWLCLAG